MACYGTNSMNKKIPAGDGVIVLGFRGVPGSFTLYGTTIDQKEMVAVFRCNVCGVTQNVARTYRPCKCVENEVADPECEQCNGVGKLPNRFLPRRDRCERRGREHIWDTKVIETKRGPMKVAIPSNYRSVDSVVEDDIPPMDRPAVIADVKGWVVTPEVSNPIAAASIAESLKELASDKTHRRFVAKRSTDNWERSMKRIKRRKS